MNSKRMFFIMVGALVSMAIAVIFMVIAGTSVLKKESKKLVDLKLENYILEEQQRAVIKANKELEQYKELEKIAKAIVPQDKDQARAVREIVQVAAKSGIRIQSVGFSASSLGSKTVTPAPAAGSTAPSTTAPSPVSQARPVEGIPGVYSLEMTLQPDDTFVSYYTFLSFLERLEKNRRTAHVSRIKIDPNPASTKGDLSFNLVLDLYIKP